MPFYLGARRHGQSGIRKYVPPGQCTFSSRGRKNIGNHQVVFERVLLFKDVEGARVAIVRGSSGKKGASSNHILVLREERAYREEGA